MLLRNIVKELSDTVEDLSGDIGRLSSEKNPPRPIRDTDHSQDTQEKRKRQRINRLRPFKASGFLISLIYYP